MQSQDSFFSCTQLTRTPSRVWQSKAMSRRPKLDDRHLELVHTAVNLIYSARTYNVSRHSVATTNRRVHRRHIHLKAPWQCRKKLYGVRTTTVEKELQVGIQAASDSLVHKGQQPSEHRLCSRIWQWKFTPAGIPRHPRCDVTDSVHILMLVGKVY